MTSVRDIAKLAGVSPITVSRALRDHPNVHPGTRARILELAELYHYRPNRLVQGLMTGKSATLGFILPNMGASYYNSILGQVVEAMFVESYHVIILQNHHEVLHTCRAIQTLVEQRVDGIIIAAGHQLPIPRTALLEMWSHGVIPISIDNTTFTTAVDLVMTDEDALAELSVNYLISLGHQRIAYVGLAYDTPARRTLAIKRLLEKRKLPTHYFYFTSGDLEADGIFPRMLAEPKSPTAVIAFSDEVAARVLQQATALGLRVPRDLSVLGCGNLSFGPMLTPPLTTIQQYPERIGALAADLFFRRLACDVEPAAFTPETILVPPSLVERHSCARPRAESR